MAENQPNYERQAREMEEIARACGHADNTARYALTARALRRKAHVLAAGATFRLGKPIVHDPFSRIWWVVLLRALAAVVFGVLTLAWPRHSALTLLSLFGAYALFDGLSALLISIRAKRPRLWVTAVLSLVAGIFAFTQPKLLALALIGILGAWLVLRGLTEILSEPSAPRSADAAAAPARRHWSVVTNGLMSVLFGVGLIAAPKIGALGLMWATGTWAILHGLLMTPFAFSLRRRDGPLGPSSANEPER